MLQMSTVGRKSFLLPPPGARGIIVPIKRRSPAAIGPRAEQGYWD